MPVLLVVLRKISSCWKYDICPGALQESCNDRPVAQSLVPAIAVERNLFLAPESEQHIQRLSCVGIVHFSKELRNVDTCEGLFVPLSFSPKPKILFVQILARRKRSQLFYPGQAWLLIVPDDCERAVKRVIWSGVSNVAYVDHVNPASSSRGIREDTDGGCLTAPSFRCNRGTPDVA